MKISSSLVSAHTHHTRRYEWHHLLEETNLYVFFPHKELALLELLLFEELLQKFYCKRQKVNIWKYAQESNEKLLVEPSHV
jgi:hypothetical protein